MQPGPSPRNYRTPHSGVSQPGIGHILINEAWGSHANTPRSTKGQYAHMPLEPPMSQKTQRRAFTFTQRLHEQNHSLTSRIAKGPASEKRRGLQCRWISSESDLRKSQRLIHLMILVTRPEPTVRPPSRIAKPRPGSMAMGWISCTEISVVSPGMTMSVPSGRVMTPVTSVVRK